MLAELEGLDLSARFARDRMIYGLEQTPDDRLNWAPVAGAASPLVLAGKVASFVAVIAHNLEHAAFPERPAVPPPPPATREAAIECVRGAFDRYLATLAAVTPEALNRPLPMPWGGMASGRAWLALSMQVFGYLQGQLNYAQVCYGDTQPNLPPQWSPR